MWSIQFKDGSFYEPEAIDGSTWDIREAKKYASWEDAKDDSVNLVPNEVIATPDEALEVLVPKVLWNRILEALDSARLCDHNLVMEICKELEDKKFDEI